MKKIIIFCIIVNLVFTVYASVLPDEYLENLFVEDSIHLLSKVGKGNSLLSLSDDEQKAIKFGKSLKDWAINNENKHLMVGGVIYSDPVTASYFKNLVLTGKTEVSLLNNNEKLVSNDGDVPYWHKFKGMVAAYGGESMKSWASEYINSNAGEFIYGSASHYLDTNLSVKTAVTSIASYIKSTKGASCGEAILAFGEDEEKMYVGIETKSIVGDNCEIDMTRGQVESILESKVDFDAFASCLRIKLDNVYTYIKILKGDTLLHSWNEIPCHI